MKHQGKEAIGKKIICFRFIRIVESNYYTESKNILPQFYGRSTYYTVQIYMLNQYPNMVTYIRQYSNR